MGSSPLAAESICRRGPLHRQPPVGQALHHKGRLAHGPGRAPAPRPGRREHGCRLGPGVHHRLPVAVYRRGAVGLDLWRLALPRESRDVLFTPSCLHRLIVTKTWTTGRRLAMHQRRQRRHRRCHHGRPARHVCAPPGDGAQESLDHGGVWMPHPVSLLGSTRPQAADDVMQASSRPSFATPSTCSAPTARPTPRWTCGSPPSSCRWCSASASWSPACPI